MIGETLGRYEIIEPLGAGGMGEVYRARDIRLDREAAIKVLPESLASDPQRLARLEREAKLLASLSHANIAVVYGLEDVGGVRFIAMECVDGETLADRLRLAGALEPPTAIEVRLRIAEALEAAHDRGVIHRDLKPANVMLTDHGGVKVLDFGLARAVEPAVEANASTSPTQADLTQAGVIMGTPAYMSPEQARGEPVDRRVDNWAFGCLLYEMLTGRPPFRAGTSSETIAHILEREVDWSILPGATPGAVRSLLHRCLRLPVLLP